MNLQLERVHADAIFKKRDEPDGRDGDLPSIRLSWRHAPWAQTRWRSSARAITTGAMVATVSNIASCGSGFVSRPPCTLDWLSLVPANRNLEMGSRLMAARTGMVMKWDAAALGGG